jgi:hypothetical protein
LLSDDFIGSFNVFQPITVVNATANFSSSQSFIPAVSIIPPLLAYKSSFTFVATMQHLLMDNYVPYISFEHNYATSITYTANDQGTGAILTEKMIDGDVRQWYQRLGKCLNSSWYKSINYNEEGIKIRNGWIFLSLANANCFGYSTSKVAYVYLNDTHVYEAVLQSNANSDYTNIPTMGLLKIELGTVIEGGNSGLYTQPKITSLDLLLGWSLMILNMIAFMCTCYCFALKDSARKSIEIESDRKAVQFTIDDDSIMMESEEISSRRVSIGHSFPLFHRMNLDSDSGRHIEMTTTAKNIK